MPSRAAVRLVAVIAAGLSLIGCTSGPAAVTPSAVAPGVVQPGWEVTVYYTAVESFHHGEPVAVTDLGDGNVLVERHAEGAQLALAGPQEVLVGERATFEARASGVTTWTWIAPDGVALVDRATLTFATSSVGFAVVQLLGVTEDGEVLHVEHRLDVRPAPD
jgi:hypothetical protein